MKSITYIKTVQGKNIANRKNNRSQILQMKLKKIVSHVPQILYVS